MAKPLLFVWAGERHKGNHQRPQRGDVVSIHPDTVYPGSSILGNPEWRLIEVDIQVDDPIQALFWLTAFDDAPEGFLRWFRRHTLDLDALERAVERRIARILAADDRLSVTPDALRELVSIKLALPDPRIIRP